MKNLRFKFATAALVLGVGSAMATTHHAFATRIWGYDQSSHQYIDVATTPGYLCEFSTKVCTVEYPAAVNPNNQATDTYPGTAQPSATVLGDYLH
jgi:hypothetical protein